MRKRKFQVVGRTDLRGSMYFELPGPPHVRRFEIKSHGGLTFWEHKWLATGYWGHREITVDVVHVDDPQLLEEALATLPETLRASVLAESIRNR